MAIRRIVMVAVTPVTVSITSAATVFLSALNPVMTEIPPMMAMGAVPLVLEREAVVMVFFSHSSKLVMMATPMLAAVVMPIVLLGDPVQPAVTVSTALKLNFAMTVGPIAAVTVTLIVLEPV